MHLLGSQDEVHRQYPARQDRDTVRVSEDLFSRAPYSISRVGDLVLRFVLQIAHGLASFFSAQPVVIENFSPRVAGALRSLFQNIARSACNVTDLPSRFAASFAG
ncbi:MAG: hypothetical protein WBW33_08465 [Bryobacteraceae bacterium]